jgi:hypothetical protein
MKDWGSGPRTLHRYEPQGCVDEGEFRPRTYSEGYREGRQDALAQVTAILNAERSWSPDTLDRIAEFLSQAGCTIADVDESYLRWWLRDLLHRWDEVGFECSLDGRRPPVRAYVARYALRRFFRS